MLFSSYFSFKSISLLSYISFDSTVDIKKYYKPKTRKNLKNTLKKPNELKPSIFKSSTKNEDCFI